MTTRRSRGDGGLHWDAGRKRWIASVTTGYDGRGKRIVRKAAGRTKTEAKRKLREVLRDHEDGIVVDDAGYTVGQAVEDWLVHGLANRDRETRKANTSLCNNHVVPYLGARKLRDLTAREVDQWLTRLAKTLSTRTLRSVHACLNRAVRRAMARDRVKRNVVELCTVPTGQVGRPSKSLTPQQAEAVITETAGHRMHNYIVVSLLTGARTEELRALRWEHVHLDGRPDLQPPVPAHIEVWRSVRNGGDTKTRKSRRTLALAARCVEALRRQRVEQEAERRAAGSRWVDAGLVFPTSVGTEMDKDNARRAFRSALAQVSGINPNDWTPRELRHSFVSILSDSGVPLEEISRLVGHSGTSVTELVYRHQIRPVIQTGAVVMDTLFGAKADAQMATDSHSVSHSPTKEAHPDEPERGP
jgi:integrase